MANYIVKAAPYCTINSTCYVAQVEYNGAPDVLIPVINVVVTPIVAVVVKPTVKNVDSVA